MLSFLVEDGGGMDSFARSCRVDNADDRGAEMGYRKVFWCCLGWCAALSMFDITLCCFC